MRGKAWEGKLPKTMDRASPGHCKGCKKDVQDLDAHNRATHRTPKPKKAKS